ERSSLYEQVGEHKQTMEGYHRILSLLPPSDGEHFMPLSRDMAKYEAPISDHNQILEVVILDDVPVDIRVKMMVCLIHQHVIKPLDPMLTSLMEQSPEELGDLYLDVAEAFMEEGEYKSALPLLSALVCSERYNLAVVWLQHAECLKALGHLEVAVKSYSKVVEMAPLHLDARLSCVYGVEQVYGYMCDVFQELKLLLHRSTLLLAQGCTDDYIDTVLTMLSMLLKVAMVRAQVCVVSDMSSGVKHLKLIKVSCNKQTEIVDQEAAYLDVTCKTSVLSRDDWWKLLLCCLAILCEVKRFAETELLVDSTLEYYSFYDDRVKRKEFEYLGLSTAFLDHNFRKAYDYKVSRLDVTLHSQVARHHFCLRLMLKHPDNHALYLLNRHTSLVSGTFKHALGQYMQVFRNQPDHPLHSLVVILTFFHMACQRFVMKRLICVYVYISHILDVCPGFSYLWRYADLRGHCQESLYNIGGIDDDQVDLRREIAYNLSLIYQSSGNKEMARHVIYTYCTVCLNVQTHKFHQQLLLQMYKIYNIFFNKLIYNIHALFDSDLCVSSGEE
uniref:General transcription factor IIIC, polypeptide 3 n=1 Tax=Cyprinus carpio TaxID=7962 RepID=A0A8C1YT11_CYPCA